MFVRILMLGAIVALAACGGARGPVDVPGAPGVTMPRRVAAQLDARWSGWQVVPPGPEAAACSTRFSEPPAPVVRGDWNGDGTTDLALQIATADGRRVVAAFERLDGEYLVEEVAAAPDTGAVLGIKRKATTYRMSPDGVPFYYGVDTIAFGVCTQPLMAYFWTGTGFEGMEVYD